jgi:hypothetical protein
LKAPRINTWLIVLGLLLAMTVGKPVFAEEPSRILILPFNIYAEKDISFLKSGIWDMLSTRLYQEGKVSILGKGISKTAVVDFNDPVNEGVAVKAGKMLSADYVIFGSLTVFGDTVSTDARFIHIPTGSSKVTFNRSGTQHGDVILHINEFAGVINETVFGGMSVLKPAIPQKKPLPKNRMNPELLWEKEQAGTAVEATPPVVATPPAIPVRPLPVAAAASPVVKPSVPHQPAGFWKSAEFSFKINGLAVGDVDGDGMAEIVFATERDIYIYRITDRGIESFSVIKGKRTRNLISIDVADMNQNGRDEIFVTNFLTENAVNNSFVLEWDGKSFKTLAQKQNWYFRVIRNPDNHPVLLGQKRTSEDKFFSGPVSRLAYANGGYEAVESVRLPTGVNLYAFGRGDALNDGRNRIITYAHNDHLKIIGESGSEDVTADDAYGGGSVMLEFPRDRKTYADEEDRYYIPQRLFVKDLDNDGKNEVIAVKNTDSAGRLFKRFRLYKTGSIEALHWNALAFDKKMTTKEISGYIADYAVVDLNNDGNGELVYAVVKGGGSFFGKAKSFIVYQSFHQAQ